MVLPPFDEAGLLPPGDYPLTLEQLKRSMLVRGPLLAPDDWDQAWRGQLVDNLAIFVRQLWQEGIDRIFVDGSFVTSKGHPKDIDAYFEVDGTVWPDIIRRLDRLEPAGMWIKRDFKQKPRRQREAERAPMWNRYQVDLYPHYGQPAVTVMVGSRPVPLVFPAFFRMTRSGEQKGIVQIVRSPDPPE